MLFFIILLLLYSMNVHEVFKIKLNNSSDQAKIKTKGKFLDKSPIFFPYLLNKLKRSNETSDDHYIKNALFFFDSTDKSRRNPNIVSLA